MKLLDCTLRDGGYYNNWDFSEEIIEAYLYAMVSININYIELGFRSLKNEKFSGAFAFTKDSFIKSLNIPEILKIGVMINAKELAEDPIEIFSVLKQIFSSKKDSSLTFVRIATYFQDINKALHACKWLHENGYLVMINLMQISDFSKEEIYDVTKKVKEYPLDVLYFADSMGSLNCEKTSEIIYNIQKYWDGPIGFHAHDNMGRALINSIKSFEEGVVWNDCTVLGMGRGAGNTQTEYLILELEGLLKNNSNINPLITLINKYFKPMKEMYKWGTNTFYFLTGKYGIHSAYVQEMLTDSRYDEKDILSVINYLKNTGGKRFNKSTLESARHFFHGEPVGTWIPETLIEGQEVLILGPGPGSFKYKKIIEYFIMNNKPFVIALNTLSVIDEKLIDIRTACHPTRLLVDFNAYSKLTQPLAVPASMLPKEVLQSLKNKKLLDFGLTVSNNTFKFTDQYCVIPNSLVIAYTLAITASGKAKRVLLAGFDGYKAGDPKNTEMDNLLEIYSKNNNVPPITAITPSRYNINKKSIYGM